jgi:acetyl-CoA carboxylase carboxyl transferase subunit alpha
LVDGIIKEPLGGAHTNIPEVHKIVKAEIKKQLEKLDALSPEQRIDKRIKKFCAMGVVAE